MARAEPRRCIVTGGTGRVGRAICAALAAGGARVGFTHHRAEAGARALCEELGGATTRSLDLRETAAIGPALRQLADDLGGCDAFVHAAGVASTVEPARFEKLAELDVAGWDALFAVNVKGAAFACQALADRLADAGGNVVFLSSLNGPKLVPAPAAYAASKAALVGLTQALAKELGPRGVRVNAVAPGLLDGGISVNVPEDLREEVRKHSCLRRLGRFEEVAALVAFLALENTYVTGRAIVVDGGL
jgi:3-oxoacyl-[acyl-carrier protein] reductase